MGKAPKTPATQTVINKTELPPWVNEAAQANLDQANQVAGSLPAHFTGNTVAPFNQGQQDAWSMAQGAGAAGQPSLNAAQQALMGSTAFTPPQVTPGQVSGSNIAGQQQQVSGSSIGADQIGAGTFSPDALQKYMNPFTNDVINAGLSDLDRQRQQALTQTGDQAAAAGAFGGSRQGIMEGVTNAEAARAAGELSSSLRAQNFSQAAGLLNTDNDRLLQADKSNQAADLTAAQSNQANALQAGLANQNVNLDATKSDQTNALQAGLANQAADLTGQQANQNAALDANKTGTIAASQLASLGQQQVSNQLQQASVNEGIADKQQAYDQAKINEQINQYEQNRNLPLEQLQVRLQALGMTPYGQTSTTTGPATQQAGNPLMGALGGAATGASIASTLGLTGALGGYGGMAGAGMGGLLGLLALSDEDTKTDKQKIGTDPKTGLPLYSFRYKGDPKTYPKVVGPMAQDIAKKFPAQVHRVGKKLAVNSNFLSKVAPAPALPAALTKPAVSAGAPRRRHPNIPVERVSANTNLRRLPINFLSRAG